MTERWLVVAPAWVGDTVMMQPLLARLAAQQPQALIDVLAAAFLLPLVRRMPEVAEVLVNPFGHGQLRLGRRREFGRQLAERGYRRVWVLPNSMKSALVPFWAGIPRRTGYVGEARFGLLNDRRRLDETALPLMVERFAALADEPGELLQRPVPAPRLRVDESSTRHTLAKLGLAPERPVVALCPGAEYGPAKRWPVAHFAELARQLQQRDQDIWLIGSAKDVEMAHAIVAQAGVPIHNLCGRTTLDEAIDLLGAVNQVVCNDSGLMHVAAALDKPLVAVYGSSTPKFTPPLSPQARIVSLNLPCSPCFERTCPLKHLRCLNDLPPEQVLQALDQTVQAD